MYLGTSTAQTSSANQALTGITSITGGTGTTAISLQTAATSSTSTASGAVSIVSGNATGTTSNSGAVSIDAGTATGTAGAITIGGTNAASLALGRSGVTTTLNGTVKLANIASGSDTRFVKVNSTDGSLTYDSTSYITSAVTTLSSLSTVGTIGSGTWNGGVIGGQWGGTGVANTGKTITLGGNLTTSGAYATTLTVTGATNVTLPTSGTLVTTTGTVALANGISSTGSYKIPYSDGAGSTAFTAVPSASNQVLSYNASTVGWTDAPGYTQIQAINLGSAQSFTSIPATYRELYIEVVVGAVGSITSLGIRVNGISSAGSYIFTATSIGASPALSGTSTGTSFTLVSSQITASDTYVFRLPLYWNTPPNAYGYKILEGLSPQRRVDGYAITVSAISQIDFVTGGAFTGANIVATLYGVR